MGVPLDLSERLGEIWRQGWILALDLGSKMTNGLESIQFEMAMAV
jgi:hypothetical protein